MLVQKTLTQQTSKLAGPPRAQDERTVGHLRLSVGAVGIFLPIALITGNVLLHDKTIVPDSMSGSYYTSTRNLFVGSLCALGVFLICYRHSRRQDLCTTFAGACALAVAFSPTAPPLPRREPSWVNYLHQSAAGALILTLGLFCWVVFADYDRPVVPQHASVGEHLKAWWTIVVRTVRQGRWKSVYVISGITVLVSGLLALYTGVWPTSWSSGWPSLYLFEAIAVVAFGIAWLRAGVETMLTEMPVDGG